MRIDIRSQQRWAPWAAAIALLVTATALRAHHSARMIEMSAPIWVKGTVVRYEIVHPHTLIELDEKTDDGQVKRWTVEGPILSRIQRMGVDASLLQNGDVIEVCGFPPKPQRSAQPSSAEPDGPRRPYVHGHLLVMPDGRMQPWGPYGKLENCVRSNDRRESWLELLNTDAIARELWCMTHGPDVPTIAASKALVEEIDTLLARPCG